MIVHYSNLFPLSILEKVQVIDCIIKVRIMDLEENYGMEVLFQNVKNNVYLNSV